VRSPDGDEPVPPRGGPSSPRGPNRPPRRRAWPSEWSHPSQSVHRPHEPFIGLTRHASSAVTVVRGLDRALCHTARARLRLTRHTGGRHGCPVVSPAGTAELGYRSVVCPKTSVVVGRANLTVFMALPANESERALMSRAPNTPVRTLSVDAPPSTAMSRERWCSSSRDSTRAPPPAPPARGPYASSCE
jgi:hypothetical protein